MFCEIRWYSQKHVNTLVNTDPKCASVTNLSNNVVNARLNIDKKVKFECEVYACSQCDANNICRAHCNNCRCRWCKSGCPIEMAEGRKQSDSGKTVQAKIGKLRFFDTRVPASQGRGALAKTMTAEVTAEVQGAPVRVDAFVSIVVLERSLRVHLTLPWVVFLFSLRESPPPSNQEKKRSIPSRGQDAREGWSRWDSEQVIVPSFSDHNKKRNFVAA